MHARFESTAFGALSDMRQEPAPRPRQVGALHPQAPGVPWREQVLTLLKDSLIKELLCVVRYNHLSDDTCMLPLLSAEFLLHANEELSHAYKLARHIVELGGELDYSPDLLMRMGRATHDRHQDLKSMISAHLGSQYRIIVKYSEIMSGIDPRDMVARHLLDGLLQQEREHAEELRSWLVN
ncbi:MAG: ferritin-like domain-containing protein [Hylemonella sp.]|uniref:ferritin-like domain-containing protein n=1 Tax=Hylemonella sp. TaxID=2066020 RepID=UPI0022C63E13|nr:ferritin-like domain-containing protein [Hylemonella sp.]MCZ8252339.1 ferritin-like domain-containing protein [Hylemonella sp.]